MIKKYASISISHKVCVLQEQRQKRSLIMLGSVFMEAVCSGFEIQSSSTRVYLDLR